MTPAPFWFVDDNQNVRWAVRVSRARTSYELDASATIVFTSVDQQISTSYGFTKDQSELTRFELLDLLARAKLEEVVRCHAPVAEMVAA